MPIYECGYCGRLAEATDDHIPPKSIFASPRPSTLRSVKACADCNSGASDDDEYFRDSVLKYRGVSNLPQAQEQVAAMLRAAGKPAKRRYAESILRSFIEVELRSQAGLHLGRAPAFKVDGDRIQRAVRRYVRGLHRYELGRRVPSEVRVSAGVDPEKTLGVAARAQALFAGGTGRVIQPGVFEYAWVTTADNPDASAWLLVFFGCFPVLSLVHSGDGAGLRSA